MNPPLLVIFRGLPGSGKSTLAEALAKAKGFAWLRIDTIEQAMRDALDLGWDIGPGGYIVAYRMAAENLKLGIGVVADCVNPIPLTRRAWRDVAREAGVCAIEVETICSNRAEHRRRVETRAVTVANLRRVTWEEIMEGREREYDRAPADITIETAGRSVGECLAGLAEQLSAKP